MKGSTVATIPANRERLFAPRKQQGFFFYPGSKTQLKSLLLSVVQVNWKSKTNLFL